MKKVSFLLSLCYGLFLIQPLMAAVTTNQAKPQPESYFLSEPNSPVNSAASINDTAPSATESSSASEPLSSPSINSNFEAPPAPMRLYPTSTPTVIPASTNKAPLNNETKPSSVLQNSYPKATQNLLLNRQKPAEPAQAGCNQTYEGYRYTGQAQMSSDNCCDQQEPADQACGDCYCLYCHYRPCYYYTTECEYIPQYEFQRCCRYVPQYYNETRCKQVPEYYKIMRCKTVKEPYCVTRCCYVEGYNSQTGCCEPTLQYYQDTCYRDVPQYYEETCCRQIPQYYEETCCRYVPQYYYNCQCKYCPQYKYKRQCKYIPQYYYKQDSTCNQGGMQGPDCCQSY